MHKLLATMFAFLLLGSAQAAGLYRWTDGEGNVHYGDYPAGDAKQVQEKKFAPETSTDDDSLPYASRVAKQNFPVTLYVTENCGEACAQGRALLNKRGIPFAEKNISTQADADALKQAAGSAPIPTLAVGRTFLKGFEAGQWNNELDIAGYPKTAPYGFKPIPPSKPAMPASAPVAATPDNGNEPAPVEVPQ